jgi:MFS family permease
VSLFSDLSHEAVTSLLPLLLVSIGGSPAALGAIEGTSDALSTFAKLAGGWAADRARRIKPLALIGYVLTTLAIPAIALARSSVTVAVLRAIGWVGRGFRSPLRDTLIVRSVSPGATGRAFGLERALDQMGAVLAPVAVLLLIAASLDLRTIMALSLVPGLVAVGCLLVFVREHPRYVAPASGGDASDGVALSRPMRRFLLAIALFGSGDFAKTLLVLWALGPAGGSLTPTVLGTGVMLYAWFNLVTVGAAYFAGRLSDSVGRKPVLVASYVLGAAGAAVPVLASPGWGAGALALALSGLLVGGEESVERAWAADLAGGRQGRAFGLLHATNGAADLVASGGVGLLWAWQGPEVAFGIAAVLMASGTCLTTTIRTGPRPDRALAPR